MLFNLAKVLLCATIAPLASAAAIDKRLTPAPDQDPFRTPPAGFQNKAPGTILASRSVTLSGISNLKSAYQFLYRTNDQDNNAIATVVTVMVPSGKNADPTKHVAYSYAYDSAWVDCGPSYALQSFAPLDVAGTGGIESGSVSSALGAGYYVSTSDYEGPLASFTNGLVSGRALLDSVRAAQSSTSTTGLSKSAKTVLWGYSGGALASEWASELAAQYAPDLNIIGAALGGLTPNVTSVAQLINKTFYAGIIPAGIQGLANAFPDLQNYINQHLVNNAAKWNSSKTQCLIGDIIGFAFQDLFSYFDVGIEAFSAPLALSIINKVGVMGLVGRDQRSIPSVPLYFYKGGEDDISPISDTTALYNKYCAGGAQIQYDIYPTENHLQLISDGAARAFAYVQGRFNGTVQQAGCFTENVST